LAGRAQTPNAGLSHSNKSLSTGGALGHNLRSWQAVTTFAPRHPSGEEPLRSFARAGDQPKEKGINSHTSPRPGRRYCILHARHKLEAGRGLGSRPRGLQGPRAYRGLFCGSRCDLVRIFLTGQIGGRVDSGVVPCRDILGSRSWGCDNPGRSSLLGGRGVSLRCGSRAGTASMGTSGRAGSSALVSLATSFYCGEQRLSSMRPESPPISSLRALLEHEGSGAGVMVSSEATVEGGWAAESIERGDLQSGRPTPESIGAAAVK
jgi:hypothetical protein